MSAPEHEALEQAGGRAPATAVFPVNARLRLGLLTGVLLAMLWVYRDTAESMVAIWARSDTFAHGYLIAPISLWLIWRQREQLRGIPLRHSVVGLLALATAGFAWLLGELASVAAVSQFALVGMIVALVWAVTGTQMARALAFPLGFLFFLVPVGEFLFPWMMDRTTDFVIWGLRSSGVPVYAEGRNLVIPSGHWAVVEGCSGVRYLIASVVVGSLYAYLTYRSLARRLLFVGVSVVLPVFANWLRAYGIVMLAHVSDNRIAAGVDHLVYGWVFFGAVMLLLFWVGGRWREDVGSASLDPSRVQRPLATHWNLRGAAPALGFAVVTALPWPFALAALDARTNAAPVTLAGMRASGEWTQVEAALLPNWTPHYSGMRSELRQVWSRNGVPVGLYVAYYRNQRPGYELVSFNNRILKYKDPVWSAASYGARAIDFGSDKVDVHTSEIFTRRERLLVWHWYWVDGHWTSSDHVAKLWQAWLRLRGGGDDSAVVMVFTPVSDGRGGTAVESLAAFVRDMGSELDTLLARTMERADGLGR